MGENAESVERMDSEIRTVGNIDAVASDVLEAFDYAALGHIHKPQMVLKNYAAFSGSLEPLDQNETGRHGFLLGEITEKGAQIRFVPFAKGSTYTCISQWI